MRRPIKPFVTEYRSTGRRQGAPGPTSKTDLFAAEMERLEPRPQPEPRAFDPGPQEDSYEAALRAADALFSGQRAPVVDAQPDKPFDPTGEATSRVGAPADQSDPVDPTKHPSGGRILRAIDEPVSAELLRLEAEFAPKRRGRKPGSKNKPKIPASVAVALEQDAVPPRDVAAAHPAASQAVAAAAVAPRALTPHVVPPQFAAPLSAPRVSASQVAAAAAQAVAAGPGVPRGERYAWVRTRLKPGEQWKRRLPKVAW